MQADGSSEPARLPITNTNLRIQPHGIYVSNKTDLLYAVNHAEDYSGVEIFRINYGTSAADTQLSHVHTVTSDTFPGFHSINDVVEGKQQGELYVTQWLAFGNPPRGKKNPASVMDRIKAAALLPVALAGIALTTVHRCEWIEGGANKCQRASSINLQMANGITTSTDRSQVFVADLLAKAVFVFNATSRLTEPLELVDKIDVVAAPDNLEYDPPTGQLILGSIPLLWVPVQNDGKPHDQHAPVPGTAMVGWPTPSGGWEVSTALAHDGTKLSQVSAASFYGSTLWLGSPHSPGVLKCTL